MKKQYCIYFRTREYYYISHQSELIETVIKDISDWNKFETKEECVNFMLNPENAHFFQEDVEYLVFETFVKIKKK